MNIDGRVLLYQDMVLVVRSTVGDPLPHLVDRCLIEEWTALWHAGADGLGSFQFVDDVAHVRLTGLDAVEPYLEARCVDQ